MASVGRNPSALAGSRAECGVTPNPARVLAIDYGRRRLGLALSDALGLTAQPLTTLARANRRDDLRWLRELVRRHGVQRIIVGHPLHLDGSAGEMAAEAARFAARIEKQLSLPVELVDERLSSWEAEQMHAVKEAYSAERRGLARRQGGRGVRRRRGRGVRIQESPKIDQMAAAVILRDYLGRERARADSAESAATIPTQQARHKREQARS
ncbi:MAG: Holliday junction resolvase RuvX [Acidobacteria bacterium]|nr:MAG: Holliday junction resolvase RuvX [Acidobacteriota bacterium]